MKKIVLLKIVLVLAFSNLLVSCSSHGIIGVFGDCLKRLPNQIDSFGSFIKASLILLIIELIFAICLSMLMGRLASLITSIILFFLVLFEKDYGFFTTVLLFLLPTVLLFLLPTVLSFLLALFGGILDLLFNKRK